MGAQSVEAAVNRSERNYEVEVGVLLDSLAKEAMPGLSTDWEESTKGRTHR